LPPPKNYYNHTQTKKVFKLVDNIAFDTALHGIGSDRTLAESSLLENYIDFKNEKTNESRIKLGKQLCEQFIYDSFKPAEQQIVKEILRLMVNDVDVSLRREISENLKLSPKLPKDVALKLAEDVFEVSEPILLCSPVLTEQDLIHIIESANEAAKWVAIATRPNITDNVANSLIKTGDDDTAETLITNPRSTVSEENLWKIVNNYKSPNVMEALVIRGNLPPEIAEKIVYAVSYEYQERIRQEYNLSPEQARKSANKARENVVLSTVSLQQSKQKSSKLVAHLFDSGRLTQSIILKALTQGEYYFFAYGLAKLAGIPESNAESLLNPQESAGFSVLYHAASFPPSLYEAVRELKDIVLSNFNAMLNETKEERSKRLAEHIMSENLDSSIPQMHYLLTLIRNNS
jgi:uncharacterized protein (DUF2336 family)